jgi:hypothetical protein
MRSAGGADRLANIEEFDKAFNLVRPLGEVNIVFDARVFGLHDSMPLSSGDSSIIVHAVVS